MLPPTHSRICPALCPSLCALPQLQVDIDTVIVDEAGCVAEMAMPVLFKLSPTNLVLVGDHLQLPAFTDLHSPPLNHCRRCLCQPAALLPLLPLRCRRCSLPGAALTFAAWQDAPTGQPLASVC